jgi:hypothetical protein
MFSLWPSRFPFRTARLVPPSLPLLESCALLIARELELGARIDVIAAGPPVLSAVASRPALGLQCLQRGLRRFPQRAAIEPAQHDIRLRVLELLQRRQQFLGTARAERRRRRARDDDPVRVTAGHD